MKYIIEKNYMILKVVQKEKVDLYTLIDLDEGDKVTAVGVKCEEELKRLDVVSVVISLTVKTEKITTKKDGDKYIQVANTFVSAIEKVTVG